MHDVRRLRAAAETGAVSTVATDSRRSTSLPPGEDALELYATVFTEIMQPSANCVPRPGPKHPGPEPPQDLVLPSDPTWQEIVYYRLVDKQRKINMMRSDTLGLHGTHPPPEHISEWEAMRRSSCSGQKKVKTERRGSSRISRPNTSSQPSITYHATTPTVDDLRPPTIRDVANAGRLLSKPPLPVEFLDENDMRNVYTLIYDVFRYKNILEQALQDVSFFALNPEYEPTGRQIVWLMLYELHARSYTDRTQCERQACDSAWCECGCRPPLLNVEKALWSTRIKLAASVSRARIKRGAVRLSDLLPKHLRSAPPSARDGKSSSGTDYLEPPATRPVAAWVNGKTIKSPQILTDHLRDELGLDPLEPGEQELVSGRYRWCPACPMFILFAAEDRALLAASRTARDTRLIMQERAFCYGAATLCRRLHDLELDGSVLLTHVQTPRAAGYLAQLLRQEERTPALLAYGAGDRKRECEQLMQKIGADNALVYTRRLAECEMSSDPLFENVVAVLAAPPSSCSAVADPVELVCGRGGDLDTLELMTDVSGDTDGRSAAKERVAAVLAEQRATLLAAMSRPHVQVVLYETHSRLAAENQDMVRQALEEVNHEARWKHAERRGEFKYRLPGPPGSREQLAANSEYELGTQSIEEDEVTCPSDDEKHSIPDTDLFEQVPIPDLCHKGDGCIRLREEGVYLALLQRKDIVNLDSKYMIKMAEARGLFGAGIGAGGGPGGPGGAGRGRRTAQTAGTGGGRKGKRGRRGAANTPEGHKHVFDVDRIAAHTHCSLLRSTCCDRPGPCPRHKLLEDAPCAGTSNNPSPNAPSPAKRWWAETARYLARLRKSLVRQKLVSSRPNILNKLLPDGEDVAKQLHNIDEILRHATEQNPHKVNTTSAPNIPPFPRLRLTRPPPKQDRVPFPVCSCSVELPRPSHYT